MNPRPRPRKRSRQRHHPRAHAAPTSAVALAAVLAAACLLSAPAARAATTTLIDPDDPGLLQLTLIDNEVVNDPQVTLDVQFEQTALPPTGAPFAGPIDPAFTGDLDAILAANALTRFDVAGVVFNRQMLDDDVTIVRDEDIDTSGDLVLTGSSPLDSLDLLDAVNDPSQFPGVAAQVFEEIDVLQGSIQYTLTLTTTRTPRFADTLTIRLFADAEPSAVPAPSAGVGGLVLLAGVAGVVGRRRRRA